MKRASLVVWGVLGVTTAACSLIVGTSDNYKTAPLPPGPNGAGDAGDAGEKPDVVEAGCEAGLTSCPSGCVVLTTAANCGACGHDCNGGTCTAGACGAYVIAIQPTTGAVEKVATDGTRVLWADTGTSTISQIPAKGGAPIVLAASSAANGPIAPELALGKSTVAFAWNGGSNSPSVGLASVDQAGSGVPVFTSGILQVFGVSIDPSAAHVAYLNAQGTQWSINDCQITPPHTGGNCAFPGPGNGRFVTQTASDDNYMFFDVTGNNDTSKEGLWLDPVSNGVATQFAPSTDLASSLAVDGTWAYWTEANDGGATYAIRRTSEGSPGATWQMPVVSANSPAFATDGTNVYYWNGSHVASRPVAGGTETLLAPATAFTQIAVGGGLLVWTDGATITGLVLP